ncbi:MAG: hypothetical protein KGI08_10100 [Thaumarchaeota archaeon]|nr:hypothetical protein [Nitrososphaerota archaeon]
MDTKIGFEQNNNHMTEHVGTSVQRSVQERGKMFKCTFSVYVKRAKTGKTEIICQDSDNVHNTGGVDFLHYQGYTSTGTGSTSDINTATQGANWLALSSNAGGASAAHTSLAGEYSTLGLSRAQCTTRSHSAGTNVTTLSKTFTATGTATAVQLGALFNASLSGVECHEFTFASTDLNNGDQITLVITVTGG